MDLEYYQIFFITAVLYAVGVGFYYLLINDFLRRPPEKSEGSVALEISFRGVNRG